MKPINVCFISLHNFPLFIPNSLDYFGGAEVQISLIARELAKDKNFQVSLITGDYNQPAILKKDKVTIFKTKVWDFLSVLNRVNSDIYIERTINPKILIVGLWCKIFKKKFIYMVAHDWDITNRMIKLANLIVCQSRFQQDKLGGVLMRPIINSSQTKINAKQRYILWAGRADIWKQPLEFIKLAKKYPLEKFIIICRQGKNRKLFRQVKRQTENLPNVKFIPQASYLQTESFFQRAKLLVNTSTAEGWPNTFLQAGAAKIPVLSFHVNPDGYLTKFHCGLVGRRLLKQNKNAGKNHFLYVKTNHSLKNIQIFKRALYRL